MVAVPSAEQVAAALLMVGMLGTLGATLMVADVAPETHPVVMFLEVTLYVFDDNPLKVVLV